jgi:hypothetical protein
MHLPVPDAGIVALCRPPITYTRGMDIEWLSQFTLLSNGDRHEKELWPLLSKDFPLYEKLWQRLVVPMTRRVDPSVSIASNERNRLREEVSLLYERVAMAHYSVFYFVGRAVRRLANDEDAMENPEDVFFLLDSAGDNLKRFSLALNEFAKDWGGQIFEPKVANFPKGFKPFEEIEAYRDALLHNSVLGRGVNVKKVFLPKWHPRPPISPLERVAASWRKAEQLRQEELIDTKALFDRLLRELFQLLDKLWSTALHALDSPAAVAKMKRVFCISDSDISSVDFSGSTANPLSASGTRIIPEE